eukprot:TRINITY_DN8123_c0_g1_i1.p1 TRINITY_DN8123_c0_g1~~TRINITY_DN8123_c0_g1_i1.p1  ORF type:complete len:366 (-),score=81.11 TRINITY_DN8123_c0_g1_i1:279-1376(-)
MKQNGNKNYDGQKRISDYFTKSVSQRVLPIRPTETPPRKKRKIIPANPRPIQTPKSPKLRKFQSSVAIAQPNNLRKSIDSKDQSRSKLIKEHTFANGLTLQIRHGDITEEHVDAIVNAANSHLAHGGGVAGAIRRAGGPQVQLESDKWVRKNGAVPTGGCAVTGPGDLPSKYIIHAVGPMCFGSDDLLEKDKELSETIHCTLRECARLNLTSVSIPAISSGIFGYPKARCAQVLLDVAQEFSLQFPASSLRQLRYTNFDSTTVNIFAAEFDQRYPEKTNDTENNKKEAKNSKAEKTSKAESDKGKVNTAEMTPQTPQEEVREDLQTNTTVPQHQERKHPVNSCPNRDMAVVLGNLRKRKREQSDN